MMLPAFAMALSTGAAGPASQELPRETPPPNTCAPKESCRYVPSFSMRSAQGPVTVKMNAWSPIYQDGLLPLFPGDTVVLSIDKASGKARVVSLGHYDRLPRNNGDKASDDRITGPAISGRDELQTGVNQAPAVRTEPDTVRLSFHQVDGKTDTVLQIENGYAQSFVYSAAYSPPNVDGLYRTNVCPVPGGRVGVEGWPQPLELIVLRDLTLTDAPPPQKADDCR